MLRFKNKNKKTNQELSTSGNFRKKGLRTLELLLANGHRGRFWAGSAAGQDRLGRRARPQGSRAPAPTPAAALVASPGSRSAARAARRRLPASAQPPPPEHYLSFYLSIITVAVVAHPLTVLCLSLTHRFPLQQPAHTEAVGQPFSHAPRQESGCAGVCAHSCSRKVLCGVCLAPKQTSLLV